MEPKMIWANLASADLKRTEIFYTELGFNMNRSSDELISFSFAKHGFMILFFLTPQFEKAIKSKSANLEDQNEVIFSISAESKEEVDQWFEKVIQAGGKIFAPPHIIEPGYTFGFADPDGHKFNFLYWPGI